MSGEQGAVKERPILFSGEMVRAILEGRKTQTRRVITLTDFDKEKFLPNSDWQWRDKRGCWNDMSHADFLARMCPYGVPGDRLWVREKWAILAGVVDLRGHEDDPAYGMQDPVVYAVMDGIGFYEPKWRSPIHMPRWASRITLEITGVRVERVQDITYHDLEAEGMTGDSNQAMNDYILLWDRLNAKRGYPWADNAWVWVVEFVRLTE